MNLFWIALAATAAIVILLGLAFQLFIHWLVNDDDYDDCPDWRDDHEGDLP